MKGALLVTMPFGASNRPAIGISLLKAALVRDGLPCDIQYLNLRFAERIGTAWYQQICDLAPFLLGEWVFAADLFGDRIPSPERYFSELLHRTEYAPDDHGHEYEWAEYFGPEHAAEVLDLRAQAGPFLDECMTTVPWEAYGLVAFTTTFQQNTASLALARRLKERYPQLTIAFGGANCEGEMGVALHRLFPFIDYVSSGEGDLTFPILARQVLAGEPVGEIPGVTRRVDGQTCPPREDGAPVQDMDALPVPNYDDYVQQVAPLAARLLIEPRLQIETSRGCWWGQKSHCTFCGLNGLTMTYRSKSPERALAELIELTERYQTRALDAVDNIIDMRYLKEMLPRLKELGLEIDLFYETKANLRKDQVRLLAETGVVQIQPGIESLSTNVLRLMRKGVSSLQNIQLLRWCAEYMVRPIWNVIAGFPGEDPADYARQAEIVPLLAHLPAPQALGPLRLDRFSPLFIDSEAMGVRNVRAYRAYQYVYPFCAEDLASLAYSFDFDYADGREVMSYIGDLQRQVGRWGSASNRSQLTSLLDGDTLVICDTRAVATRLEHRLQGLQRAVYDACDQARSREQVAAHLVGRLAEQHAAADLDAVLAELVAEKLMLHQDGRYLSLAVSAEYQLEELAPRYVERSTLSPTMRLALSRLLDPAAPTLNALLAAKLVSLTSPPFPFIGVPVHAPAVAVGAPS